MAPTPFLRMLAREVLWRSQELGLPFYDVLKAAARKQFKEAGSGKILTNFTVGQHTSSFQVPQLGYHLTPSTILEAFEELLTLREQFAAGTNPPVDDAAMASAMLRDLQPMTEMTSDHRFALQEVGGL